tara:strand:+ start:2179 stop:2742 length:564 start_codon:yes stop_codon:yes gene_type:complete
MLNAVFARPVGIFDNWFNKVVSYMTGGNFCHSEFVFSWTPTEAKHFFSNLEGHDKFKNNYKRYIEDGKLHVCFYILWGDVLSYRLLKYQHNNPFYRVLDDSQAEKLRINLSQENEMKIASFLMSQCGKPYDYTAAVCYFVPLRNSSPEYEQYYCSELMVCALQQCRMLLEVNPSGITPNHLYKLLTA